MIVVKRFDCLTETFCLEQTRLGIESEDEPTNWDLESSRIKTPTETKFYDGGLETSRLDRHRPIELETTISEGNEVFDRSVKTGSVMGEG